MITEAGRRALGGQFKHACTGRFLVREPLHSPAEHDRERGRAEWRRGGLDHGTASLRNSRRFASKFDIAVPTPVPLALDCAPDWRPSPRFKAELF